MKPKILVLCTGNSCRSQIAEGYLRYFAKGKAEVYSAGVETHGVITVCNNAKVRYPYFPTKATKFHPNFPYTAKAKEEVINSKFSEVREMIKTYYKEFIEQNILTNN